MQMKAVERLVTSGKQDPQDRMAGRQDSIAVHQYPTPDERTDATQNDPQLVDAERCRWCGHALRVAQSIMSLKGIPGI
jgi:hypothetical protein